ncbi:MAG: mexE [Phycisphaerales bacterium]|nr:mexE [Phycisphaerales bacterium]
MIRRSGFTIALLAALAAVGCDQSTKPPPPPPPTVTVAHPLRREVVDWDEYIGHLEAKEKVDLRARVSGYLESADYKEGSLVDAGTVLFKLDPKPYQAEYDRALSEVEQAKAQAANAAAELVRIENLRRSGGGSEKEYQDARYAKMKSDAAVAAAQAAAETARLNVEYTQVKTLITGRAGNKLVTPGNLITGGTSAGTLLTTIASIDPIYCYFDADEGSVLKYQRLSHEKKRVSARDEPIPCFLQLGNEDGFPHEGVVDFVDNHLDPTTGTLRARGVFANPQGWLQKGMFARLRVPGSGRYQAILVPDAAVDINQSIKYVRVLKPDQTIEPRTVTLGALFGQFRAIESGLAGDELIVINGLQRAFPGSKVIPQQVALDPNAVPLTAGGAASTQALPATRFMPATMPSTPPATKPAAPNATTRPTTQPAVAAPRTLPAPNPTPPDRGAADDNK